MFTHQKQRWLCLLIEHFMHNTEKLEKKKKKPYVFTEYFIYNLQKLEVNFTSQGQGPWKPLLEHFLAGAALWNKNTQAHVYIIVVETDAAGFFGCENWMYNPVEWPAEIVLLLKMPYSWCWRRRAE